jgi:hypothetical protein
MLLFGTIRPSASFSCKRRRFVMPSTIPISPADETRRGPQPAPGGPDPSKDKPATPPVTDEDDKKKPDDPTVLDPTLLPIGDPAGMA